MCRIRSPRITTGRYSQAVDMLSSDNVTGRDAVLCRLVVKRWEERSGEDVNIAEPVFCEFLDVVTRYNLFCGKA
jgi:hypothetical protein